VTASATCPGCTQTAASRARPFQAISTPSPLPTCSFAAVAGEISTALSQVIFVSGLGSSCSQPLFAKRPS
jgi:hypothetical protein